MFPSRGVGGGGGEEGEEVHLFWSDRDLGMMNWWVGGLVVEEGSKGLRLMRETVRKGIEMLI